VHCVPGRKGFELLDGLPAPIDYDFFVWKGVEPDLHPYGTCFHDLAERRSTGLIEFLQARKVDTVLVGGLATDYCVKTSVLQLRRAGFRVIVHLDACRGIAPATVASAHTQMIEAGAELAQSLIDVQRLLDA
jgi:nicotinamidase/pyrazinamidase